MDAENFILNTKGTSLSFPVHIKDQFLPAYNDSFDWPC